MKISALPLIRACLSITDGCKYSDETLVTSSGILSLKLESLLIVCNYPLQA